MKIDSFDRDLIGRTIVKMMGENQYVTLLTLMSFLIKNHSLDISKSTLWRLVRSLGFCFKKTKSSKEVICESKNMISLRAKYLRKLKQLKGEQYEILYLDVHHVLFDCQPMREARKDLLPSMPSILYGPPNQLLKTSLFIK